jgi:hypothetical protein
MLGVVLQSWLDTLVGVVEQVSRVQTSVCILPFQRRCGCCTWRYILVALLQHSPINIAFSFFAVWWVQCCVVRIKKIW